MTKLSVDELQWYACVHAETDLEGLIEAYGQMPDQAAVYRDRYEQIQAYRKKRWGATGLEVALKDAKTVPVYTLINSPDREFGQPDTAEGKQP